MKKLCFVNNKGGVGKTSSVQNIGAYLARQGYRVLLIDLDPQSNLTTSFGIDKFEVARDSGDFLLGNASFEDVALGSDTLAIIPASDSLTDKERVLQGKNMYHRFLAKQLAKVNGYHYCLMDCPPALGTVTVNALYASDFYFVPLQAAYFSYEGIRTILSFTEDVQQETGLQCGGVFATRYNPKERRKLSHDVVQATADQLGDKFMTDCYIRNNTAVDEAQSAGEDVFSYAPGSAAAHDYEVLTKEILKRVN